MEMCQASLKLWCPVMKKMERDNKMDANKGLVESVLQDIRE